MTNALISGQARMREIYKKWWDEVKNHHRKPMAIRVAMLNPHASFSLFLAIYLTMFEVGYTFGDAVIAIDLYEKVRFPLSEPLLLLICLISAVLLEHGIGQWLWGLTSRFSWRRLLLLVLFCVPFIGLLVAAELLHSRHGGVVQKPLQPPTKLVITLDRFVGTLLQQSGSLMGQNWVFLLVVFHHFLLPVYGLFAFMVSEPQVFACITIATLGHGLLAYCLYRSIGEFGQFRFYKMVLALASMVPLMPISVLVVLSASMIHSRWSRQSLLGQWLRFSKP